MLRNRALKMREKMRIEDSEHGVSWFFDSVIRLSMVEIELFFVNKQAWATKGYKSCFYYKQSFPYSSPHALFYYIMAFQVI